MNATSRQTTPTSTNDQKRGTNHSGLATTGSQGPSRGGSHPVWMGRPRKAMIGNERKQIAAIDFNPRTTQTG